MVIMVNCILANKGAQTEVTQPLLHSLAMASHMAMPNFRGWGTPP